jgi:hypothetical protein
LAVKIIQDIKLLQTQGLRKIEVELFGFFQTKMKAQKTTIKVE